MDTQVTRAVATHSAPCALGWYCQRRGDTGHPREGRGWVRLGEEALYVGEQSAHPECVEWGTRVVTKLATALRPVVDAYVQTVRGSLVKLALALRKIEAEQAQQGRS